MLPHLLNELKYSLFLCLCEMWFAHIELVIQFLTLNIHHNYFFCTTTWQFLQIKNKFDKFDVACNSIHVKRVSQSHGDMRLHKRIHNSMKEIKKKKKICQKYSWPDESVRNNSMKSYFCWFRSKKFVWQWLWDLFEVRIFDEF